MSESDPPKVLLVDDEATGRRLLRRWIERGFSGKVVEAGNGLEALEALAAEEFDLVVLDLQMPVLDGTETLSLIRSDSHHGDIEVVVATQLASEQKVRDIISLGVADYILKPLRYDSVVDRLHQIVNRARARKKERRRKTDLPVILVADSDPNFCDFAISALSGRYQGIAARTAAETLVGVLKNEPYLVMLSSTLPGLPFEMLGTKVLALAQARGGKVCLITETRTENIGKEFIGQVVRTFVPENFATEVSRLVAGSAVSGGGSESWLKALEPEVSSATRQAMGMMTGVEPQSVDELSGDPDMFVTIDLRAESGEFDLVVEMCCQRTFGVELCSAMLGSEVVDVDHELLMSGVGEILNVVGGRIKNSCGNRKIDVVLGLPELMQGPREASGSFYEWKQHFRWKDHCFRLGVSGMAGTLSTGTANVGTDAGIARSQARQDGSEPVAAAGDSSAAGGADSSKVVETAAPGAAASEAAPNADAAGPEAASASADASHQAADKPAEVGAGEAAEIEEPIEQTVE